MAVEKWQTRDLGRLEPRSLKSGEKEICHADMAGSSHSRWEPWEKIYYAGGTDLKSSIIKGRRKGASRKQTEKETERGIL